MTRHRMDRKTERQSPPLLASSALCRLVTHYVLHPRADLHFHGLKRATGLANRSLQLELVRLERLGMITRKPDGRLVRYFVQPDASRWKALRELVRQFVEPAEVLRVALAQVADITAAFIYGSFARRRDVHPDSDIDVFVVSETLDEPSTRLSLAGEILEVSGLLGREVNVSRHTPMQLAEKLSKRSRFIASVLCGEKEWLIGDQKQLSAAMSARGRALRDAIPA